MDNNGNGEHGGTSTKVTVLTLSFNHETSQVEIGGTAMCVTLAQMICGEGLRLLEESRRAACAMALRQQIAEQEQNARIAASMRKH